jgi:hypothetical protein
MTAWRDMRDAVVEIRYTAPPAVRAVIESLGRTEDVRFSPDGRRLAIAAFNRNRIAVFDIELACSAADKSVGLTGVVEISSADLKRPHGLDFIDSGTLIVANRDGNAVLFALPQGDADGRCRDLAPIHVLRAGETHLLKSPGSVSVSGGSRQAKEILICNNSANYVTRHVLDGAEGRAIGSGEILLQKWLDVPDSVSVSADRRWIAVSNHNTHSVLLYENSPSLTPSADPDGLLRCVHYPHGLRFSADGRHIFLADAGAPYVHVYAGDGQGWRGLRDPVASFRVMDDALFQKGRSSPQDGGPKGLDIHGGVNVLVVTSECQPLTFFDLSVMLDRASGGSAPAGADAVGREQQALQIRCELEIAAQSRQAQLQAEAKAARAKARLAAVKASASWRLTKPVRWLQGAFRRPS